MFRFLFVILSGILLISVIRAVAGILLKGIASFMSPASAPPPNPNASVPTAGELRKDPICGTYVSTDTQLKKISAGETYYFCSAECRDKFA